MSSDPFDALRQTAEPAHPDAAFVARLRRRVSDALADVAAQADLPVIDLESPTSPASTPATTTTPPRSTSMLVPYLSVAGAADAIDWYVTVLGARETVRYAEADGRIGHAELTIGDARIHLADEYPEFGFRGPLAVGGTSVSLHLDVADVDATYASAVEAGARSEREPSDQPYGARAATIFDPFGHRWLLQTQIATPSVAEIEAAMDGITVTEASGASSEPVELGYFTVAAPDPDGAARFYGALFGWASEEGALGGEYRHVHNTKLPLGIVPGAVGTSPVLYFRVPSVADYAAKVTELGGEVVSQDTWESGPGAECRDDQGCTFHLWEAAPGY